LNRGTVTTVKMISVIWLRGEGKMAYERL